MIDDSNHTKVEVASSQRGNGLFSTKYAEPGDELIRISSPLVAIPESEALDTVCYQCFADSSVVNLKKCTGCNIASYCSKNCQRDSWKLIHKLECQILKDVNKKQKGQQPLVTAVRAAIQILLKSRTVTKENLEDRSWQQIGLEGHMTEMKQKHPARYDGLLLQSIAAKEFSKVEADLESVLALFARMEMNGFRIHQGDNTSIGLCFSPTLSIANHSCVPNAYISFTGRHASLRALNTVQIGEELTISYIDPSFPLPIRKAGLERYYFTCTCDACSSDWDNYTLFLKTSSTYPKADPTTTTPRTKSKHTLSTSVLTSTKTQNLATASNTFIVDPTNDPILTTALNLSLANTKSPTDISTHLNQLCPLTTSSILAIQPIPTYLHTLYLHHLSNQNNLLALATMIIIIYKIDPILYPQDCHPTKVIHIFTAVKLMQEMLYQRYIQSPLPNQFPPPSPSASPFSHKLETQSQNLNLPRCIHALLILLGRLVDKSHGKDSRWAVETREMLEEIRLRPMETWEDREMEGGSERGEEVLKGCFREVGVLGDGVADVLIT